MTSRGSRARSFGLGLRTPGYPTVAFFAVAVMATTYHLFSEWFSLIVKTRSSQSVKRLPDLQPDLASVLRDACETQLPIEAVSVGDRVRVRPGERVPVDGEIVSDRSAADQSVITGEPLPVERTVGYPVIGGSINGTGALIVRVTAVGEQSFLQRVAREAQDARVLKPGLLHVVDHTLRIHAPAVLSGRGQGALAGWLIVPWLLGLHVERAVVAGSSVLVMGYS